MNQIYKTKPRSHLFSAIGILITPAWLKLNPLGFPRWVQWAIKEPAAELSGVGESTVLQNEANNMFVFNKCMSTIPNGREVNLAKLGSTITQAFATTGF